MFGCESIFELLVLCFVLIYGGGLWCFFSAWKRCRFSLWWLCAAAVLILAPVFLFTLCGYLGYFSAKRSNLPDDELEDALFYNRLGWVAALCFLLVNIVVRAVLRYALPSVECTLGLSFVLTASSWMIVSAASLLLIRMRFSR